MTEGHGRLVLVVGPSGAGKDTLLAHAADQLVDDPRFIFPKRQVTRAADAASEDHDMLERAEFERIHATNSATLSWEAHGLGYVIPWTVTDEVARGRVAVCNGSRRILPAALEKYPDCKIIVIDADRETRAKRLAARGRETEEDIIARLDRDAPIDAPGVDPIRIDNSGDLRLSVAALLSALLMIGSSTPESQSP